MKRLYVLVNNRLNPIYGAVQGGHAVAQYMLEHRDSKPGTYWKNEYLIYLSADVNKWKRRLDKDKADYSEFHEPDLNNMLTAIAIVDDGQKFKHLKLLR